MSGLNIVKDVAGVPTYIPPVTKEVHSATLAAGTSGSVVAPTGSKYVVIYYGNLNVLVSVDGVPAAPGPSFAKGLGTVARNGFPLKAGDTVHATNVSTDPSVVSFEFYTGNA